MQFVLFGIIAALAVAIDQIVKFFAVTYLRPVRSVSLIDGVFHLTYLENRGAAFGILQNRQYLFVAFTVIVLLLIVFYLWRKRPKARLLWCSLALVSGGAVGNFIDRIRLGYVVDLFDFELINFAVFNAADVFVCVGVFLAAVYIIFNKEEQ